ncbi:hypothetical protein HYU12_01825 [Candidatus Woesearchaeota archaeon]|nr:hypothetical protein [Candidatus Woesearchaeota archaeon]
MQEPKGLMQAPEGSSQLVETVESLLDEKLGDWKIHGGGGPYWPLLCYALTPYTEHLLKLTASRVNDPKDYVTPDGDRVNKDWWELICLKSEIGYPSNKETVRVDGVASLIVYWPAGSFDYADIQGSDVELPQALMHMVQQFLNGEKPPFAAIQENLPLPEVIRKELKDVGAAIKQATGIAVKYFPLEAKKDEA